MSTRVSLRPVRLGLVAVLFVASSLLTSTVTSVAAATTRFVSMGGADAGDCTVSPCTTVTYALSQASTGDTIMIAAGTYSEHGIYINKSVTLVGAGSAATIFDAAYAGRVMGTAPGTTTTISGLTMQHGSTSTSGSDGGALSAWGTVSLVDVVVRDSIARGANGAGILARGTLTLDYSTVTNNQAVMANGGEFDGGGIHVIGDVTLRHSIVSGNSANVGGGIHLGVGSVTLADSVVSGNSGAYGVAGIYSETSTTLSITNSIIGSNAGVGITSFGTLTITNSTISGNSIGAANSVGGIYTSGGTITNSTISGNSGTRSGGIWNGSGTLALTNDTVAGNSSGIYNGNNGTAPANIAVANSLLANAGANCGGVVSGIGSSGHNLDTDATCGFSQATDLRGVDPGIGPLQNNSGETPTHALLAGSPAIDAGGTSANGCPSTDQRGVARPQGAACDIGAFELASSLTLAATGISPTSGSYLGGTQVTVSGAFPFRTVTVSFGGIPATNATWVASNQVVATAPAHAPGAVNVTVSDSSGQSATLPQSFVYIGPTITGISPNHGPATGGTVVAISGTLFQNGATVTFDGIQAFSVTFNSPTLLTATTSADVTVNGRNKNVDVVVTNPDGSTATLGLGFEYQLRPGPEIPSAQPPPIPAGRTGGSVGVPPNPAPSPRS